MTGPSSKMRGTEAGRLGVGEKRPSKLEFDGATSRIDQPELPGAVNLQLPFKDLPCGFLIG